MWNDDPSIDWTGDDLHQGDQAESTPDPAVDGLPELTPLDALAPADATDVLSAPDLPATTTASPKTGVPAELDVEPRFGASSTVTADSDAEEFKYLNSTGDYRGLTTNREIDPWTGTEKK